MKETTKLTSNGCTILGILGNRCGHNPLSPRFYEPPEDHNPRPGILEIAKDKLEEFYNKPRELLISLGDARNSKRQQRTEGREGIVAVAQVIMEFLNFQTMSMTVPVEDGALLPLTVQFIATVLNFSIKRVTRAFKLLKDAGYITVVQRYKKTEDGEYQGLAAIKTVKFKFFHELGIAVDKVKARHKKAKAKRKRKLEAIKARKEEELRQQDAQRAKELAECLNKGSNGSKALSVSSRKKEQEFQKKKAAVVAIGRQRMEKKHKELTERLHELMRIPDNILKPKEELIAQHKELQELPAIERFLGI